MNTKLRIFQSHEDGDLLIRFTIEANSYDKELAAKFGEPRIEVGGEFLSPATVALVVDSGTIVEANLTSSGEPGAYSSFLPVTAVVSDPGNEGVDAAFEISVASNGTIDGIGIANGGSGYADASTLTLTGSHRTVYAPQTVKLFTGFPYTRRVNTIDAGDPSLATLATAYVAAITSRVNDALATLRALETDGRDLTSETVTQP